VLTIVLLIVCPHVAAQNPFSDDFNGTSLDLNLWTVLSGGVTVSGGLLQTSGSPDHKRIDSVPTFGPGSTATARISLGGRYQKFGFRVNPTEFDTFGYFFDTLGDNGDGTDDSVPNFVYAIAFSGPNLILRSRVPASWNQFHDFSIERTGTLATFSIDGQKVAQVADSFMGSVPIGIWNDRPELMLTDSVKVTNPRAQRQPQAELGPQGQDGRQQKTVAEPVSTGTGNYYYQHTDFIVPGRGKSLLFQRTYNTLDNYNGPLGANWTHSYNIRLTPAQNGTASIKWSDGHTEVFIPNGSIYVPQPGVYSTLAKNQDGSFSLTEKDQTRYAFSSTGQLLAYMDKNGNGTRLAYDGSGNLIQVTDPGNRSLTFLYDSGNRIVQVIDPAGHAESFGYDSANNLVQTTDTADNITTFAYDENHRVLSITLPNGNTLLQNRYDTGGRVVSQTNGLRHTWTFAYGTPNPEDTTIIDARGNKTVHTYDSLLRIVQIRDPLNGTDAFTYDANNNRTSITNQNGKTTAFVYDGQGNITTITDSNGNTNTFTFDGRNNLLSATDPKATATTFSYDSNGNLTSVVDALGNTTGLAYDGVGQIMSKTDAKGATTRYAYNAFGNLTTVTDALGHRTTLYYDAISRLTSMTDPNGHTATSTYDALSRLVKIADPLGHQTQFAYDAVGNLLKITDANGNSTSYTYDPVNNLVTVTDALNHVTKYSYDENNNRTAFINAKGNATSYAYDALNRLSAATDPLAFVTVYRYDGLGNLVAVKDANGNTNCFTYDALNRLTNISYGDGKMVTYSYDANGNRSVMTDAHGTTRYAYDILNRLTSVVNPDGNTVKYQYNAVGRRQSLTYPDGKVMTYVHDQANRISQAQDWLGRATNYNYDSTGNLLSLVYPNQARISFEYDDANRLTRVTNFTVQPGSRKDHDSNHFGVFEYLLDAVGNRLQISNEHGRVTRYSYDKLYELTGVSTERSGNEHDDQEAEEGVVTYEYDVMGNRLRQSAGHHTINYLYDTADRLLKAGTVSFTYDANGNQTSVTRTATGTPISYRYDAANRLIAVAGGAIRSSFSYDGDGNRISQTAGSNTFSYANDIASALPVVLQESVSGRDISYAYGLNLISESSRGFDDFYQYDGQGSVVGLTDIKGNLIRRYAYDAWGQAAWQDSGRGIGSINKFGYTGEALDPGTELYYLRARYYDPHIGRFLSRDPFPGPTRTPLMKNPYLYATSNPVRFADHSGLVRQDAGVPQQSLTALDFSLPNTAINPRVAGQGVGSPFCTGNLDCADYLISAVGLRFEGPVGIGFAVTSFGIELRRDSADPNAWARWTSLILDAGGLAVAVCSEFNSYCTAAEISLFAVDTLSRFSSSPDQLPITTPSVAAPISPVLLQ
jgi:RHS repeat-associated protein